MKWITRWFGGSDSGTLSAPAVGASQPLSAEPTISPAAVNVLFYRWLTGAHEQIGTASTGAEKIIIDELARLAASPGAGAELVPRVPAVIPQLLRSLRDETLSGTELSRQLAQDVVLVAEVIREANSPYYHPSIPVKSVETAVRLIGQNGLRMLLARVSFRPIISMQAGRFARQVAPQLWAQSEQCATAARLLAPGMRANIFEAYLAGLMQNVGLIVAFRLMDQIHADGALPQSDAFVSQLFAHAGTLSARIGEAWDFPVTVTAAINSASVSASSAALGATLLADTLALSDRLSKLRMLLGAGMLTPEEAVAGMDKAALACFEALNNEDQ